MEPINVQISTYWWDEQAQKDIPSNCVDVSFWSPISMSTARAFHHTCYDPQELWDYLHSLNTDKNKVLKEEFRHIPALGNTPLPADLSELFK